MRVLDAANSKSCVLMRVSRGGFNSGLKEVEISGAGWSHSSFMVEISNSPRIWEEDRLDSTRDGAWTSL